MGKKATTLKKPEVQKQNGGSKELNRQCVKTVGEQLNKNIKGNKSYKKRAHKREREMKEKR